MNIFTGFTLQKTGRPSVLQCAATQDQQGRHSVGPTPIIKYYYSYSLHSILEFSHSFICKLSTQHRTQLQHQKKCTFEIVRQLRLSSRVVKEKEIKSSSPEHTPNHRHLRHQLSCGNGSHHTQQQSLKSSRSLEKSMAEETQVWPLVLFSV